MTGSESIKFVQKLLLLGGIEKGGLEGIAAKPANLCVIQLMGLLER